MKWATWRFHQIFVSFLEKMNFFALKKDVVTHVNVAIGFLNTLVLLWTPLKLWIILCVIQTIPENMGIIFVYYYYYYRNRMRTFAWREKDKWIKTNIRTVFIICRKSLEKRNTLWNFPELLYFNSNEIFNVEKECTHRDSFWWLNQSWYVGT